MLLEWFADAPDPDAGLFGFRRISEALGRTPWYLKMLRDEGQVAERLARLLATSRYATDLLQREPQGVRLLGEDLQPLSRRGADHRDAGDRRSGRTTPRRRSARSGRSAGASCSASPPATCTTSSTWPTSGAGLSRLTDATLEATLDVVSRSVAAQRGLDAPPTRMADRRDGPLRRVRAVLRQRRRRDVRARADRRGRPAGRDVVRPGGGQRAASAPRCCPAPTRRSRWTRGCGPRASRGRWCAPSTPTPPTTPSGRGCGSSRRCCAPTPSSATPGVRERFTELIDPLRYPAEGITEADLVEVRRIKARVDTERLPARRRSAHAPQARPRRPRRRRVDRAGAADEVRRPACRAAHAAHPRGARRRPAPST